MKPVIRVFARCFAAGRDFAGRIVIAALLLTAWVSTPALGQIDAALDEAMAEGGAVPVIVTFDDSQRPQSGQPGLDGIQQTKNRLEWQRGILQRAMGIDSTELAAPSAS